MSPQVLRVLHVVCTLIPIFFLVLWVRGCHGGDYLIVDTPGQSFTIYLEDARLSYYSTTQNGGRSWDFRIDHAGPRSVPEQQGAVLGFRFDRTTTDFQVGVPVLLLFLLSLPPALYLGFKHPHPHARVVGAVAFGTWPILLGLILFNAGPGFVLFVVAACIGIPVVLLRDVIRHITVHRLAPWPWQVEELRRYRRAQAGLCAFCGYDLRASQETCPECGNAIAETDVCKR